MVSSHSPSTPGTTVDRKVGPVSTYSDVETAALPEAEGERLKKSVMYVSRVFQKEKDS